MAVSYLALGCKGLLVLVPFLAPYLQVLEVHGLEGTHVVVACFLHYVWVVEGVGVPCWVAWAL